MAKDRGVDPGGVGGGVVTREGLTVYLRRVQRGGGQRFIAFPLELRERVHMIDGSVCRVWLEEGIIHIQVMDPRELAPQGEKR